MSARSVAYSEYRHDPAVTAAEAALEHFFDSTTPGEAAREDMFTREQALTIAAGAARLARQQVIKRKDGKVIMPEPQEYIGMRYEFDDGERLDG